MLESVSWLRLTKTNLGFVIFLMYPILVFGNSIWNVIDFNYNELVHIST